MLYCAALLALLCLAGCAAREGGVVYVHERPDPAYWDEVGAWPGPMFIEDRHDYAHYSGRLYHRRFHR